MQDADLVADSEPRVEQDEGVPDAARRRWPRRLVAGVLVLATFASVVAAGVSYSRGSDWQARAEVRDERIVQLEEALRRSERDVADLTERIDELVASRSEAESERDGALVEAQAAAELTRLSVLVADDLEACVDGTEALIGVMFDILAYDMSESSEFASEVGAVCSDARSSHDLLQDVIAGL